MSIKEKLIFGDELLSYKKRKKHEYEYVSVPINKVNVYLNDGWQIFREHKATTRLKKMKPFDEIFENQIWVLFCNLGFKMMNKDRNFTLSYSENRCLTQQIDVFAVDDETVLIVECKSSIIKNKKQDFKTELEAWHGKREGLFKTIKKEFPNHKIKIIFATKNYNVGKQDIERMREFGFAYFDEERISYYTALANHLGVASRYQLLGSLFANQKIPELDYVVPAISGKMGGYNYYSFSIEPEIILKLGYVLHRNNSNKDSMPTYQRLIKKSRLIKIQDFVENGGYFPNSVIVSIETGKKNLVFEQSKQNRSDSLSKIGLLHLPQVYRSIYIIDGQHRLYGYSNSKYKTTNTIPVVAFENLAQEEQIKIFMDINENQKAVPKNLRNTLDEDLKYESKDPKECREGLALKISRELGENRDSPLFDRVIVGENTPTSERCITLETLSKAIRESNFLSKYSNSKILSHGTFDMYDNDKTFDKLYPVLLECLQYLSEQLGDNEWQKGNDTKSAFVKNNVISGIIRVINSLVNYLSNNQKINPLADNYKKIVNEMKSYLKIIAEFWKNISEEEKIELSTSYGAGGPIKSCRTFEREINSHFHSFNPEGLEKYWKDRNRKNTDESIILLNTVLDVIKTSVKEMLDNKFGEGHLDLWAPKNIATRLQTKVAEHNYGKERSQYKDIWDFIDFIDLREIIIFGSNWTEVFNKKFTYPSICKGDKKEKKKWLENIFEIRKKIETTSSITQDNYEYIVNINEWLKKI